MHARHTQGLAAVGAVPSKTLVNRTRMKVVNIALTKNFRHSGMRLLAQARNPYSRWWLWIPGSRFARPGMTIYMFDAPNTSLCILPP